MPPPTVDADHPPEFDELAALAALELLEGDELARFERHAADCPRCRLTMQLDRETARRLALAAPEMEPSPDFKARLLRRAAAELAQPGQLQPQPPPPEPISLPPQRPPSEPIPVRRRGRVVPLFGRRAWASALAAVLVLGIGAAVFQAYENQVVTAVTLTGAVPGTAQVVVRRSGAAELQLQSLPSPPPGAVYEAWVIPSNQAPVAAGTTASGQATLPLPGDVRGETVAITQEAHPVDAPTSAPILAAVVA